MMSQDRLLGRSIFFSVVPARLLCRRRVELHEEPQLGAGIAASRLGRGLTGGLGQL